MTANSTNKSRRRGSVETLCHEIEFPFTPGMENTRILIAFTKRLVLEVAQMRYQAEAIKGVLRREGPSVGSGELMDKVLDTLNGPDVSVMVDQCEGLHELARELNPEDAYPTDHLVDMLASCISAIRFGCEPKRWGVGSCHAAAAGQHVWKQRYGVRLFDQHTQRWEKDWMRRLLTEALVSMALPATMGANEEELANVEQ